MPTSLNVDTIRWYVNNHGFNKIALQVLNPNYPVTDNSVHSAIASFGHKLATQRFQNEMINEGIKAYELAVR